MKLRIIILFILLSGLYQDPLIAESITIAADQWCPYNCVPASANPGFLVETSKTIFSAHNIEIKYKILPWNRAKKYAAAGIIQGLIGGTPRNTEGLNLIFPRIEQARMKNSFFTLTDSVWTFNGVDSLKQVRLGIIQGYNYGPELVQYVQQNAKNKAKLQSLAGENALVRNIKKLFKKRIDTVLEDFAVFLHTAEQNGVEDQVRYAGEYVIPYEFNNVYIAFTPSSKNSRSKLYAEILSKGMEELRSSGQLQKILAKYGLKDWR